MSANDVFPPLGQRVTGLARESLVCQQAASLSYNLANEWATEYLDPLLKAADALVLNDGRMFTKNGRIALTCNAPWAIHSTLQEFADQVVSISDWGLARLQQETVQIFESNLHPETAWLELLDGTAYYRCYPLPDGGLLVPGKPEIGTVAQGSTTWLNHRIAQLEIQVEYYRNLERERLSQGR